MLAVTRINGSPFYVNPDLIQTIEATPDTVLTLTNGEKLVISESPETVVEQVVALKRRMYMAGPDVISPPVA